MNHTNVSDCNEMVYFHADSHGRLGQSFSDIVWYVMGGLRWLLSWVSCVQIYPNSCHLKPSQICCISWEYTLNGSFIISYFNVTLMLLKATASEWWIYALKARHSIVTIFQALQHSHSRHQKTTPNLFRINWKGKLRFSNPWPLEGAMYITLW